MTSNEQLLRAALGSIILTWGSLQVIQLEWSQHKLEERLQTEGVQTSAIVTGYKYIEEHGKHAHSGDRPILSYVSADGITRTYVALEYGAVSPAEKEQLPKQAIKITYLRSDPQIARVRWFPDITRLGLFIAAALSGVTLCFYFWFLKTLISSSDMAQLEGKDELA